MKKLKPFKPHMAYPLYLNKKERWCIGADELQWILEYRSTHNYYGTLLELFNGLAEHNLRLMPSLSEKAVRQELRALRKHISKVAQAIEIKIERKV